METTEWTKLMEAGPREDFGREQQSPTQLGAENGHELVAHTHLHNTERQSLMCMYD